MSQFKKDDIKQKIQACALELFATNGFLQTTVADLSQASKVSVGNIYRYYPTKLDILEDLIQPEFFDTLKCLIQEKICKNPQETALIHFIVQNKVRFLLTFNGLKGTKYEAYADEIIDFMTELMMEQGMSLGKNLQRNLMRRFYVNYIDTLQWILMNTKEDDQFIRMIEELNLYHMSGMMALLQKGVTK